MRLQTLFSAAAALFTFGAAPVFAGNSSASDVHVIARRSGTEIAIDSNSKPLTIIYHTDQPSKTNWVGIYTKGKDPNKDSYETYKNATSPKGIVRLDVSSLAAGDYDVYFFKDGGYKSLSGPLEAFLPKYMPYFPVQKATFQNARIGDDYNAKVGGLLWNNGDATMTFAKYGGDDWIKVGTDGSIYGKPDKNAPSKSTVKIKATANSAHSTKPTIEITIPVRKAEQTLVDEFTVLQINLWHGANSLDNGFDKMIRTILDANPDFVGAQEVDTNNAATEIGKALGWCYIQLSFSTGIFTRYSCDEKDSTLSYSGSFVADLNPGTPKEPRKVYFRSLHLEYKPYGPYGFCYDKKNNKQVIEKFEEKSGRGKQIREVISRMSDAIKKAKRGEQPVVLTGDFNAPSHLDYTKSQEEEHCGAYDTKWPSSVEPEKAGLVDAYRSVHQTVDNKKDYTWSPIYTTHDEDDDYANYKNEKEPRDRIDFIYTLGLKVKSVVNLFTGYPHDHKHPEQNEWPSDHKAVKAVLQFKN